MPDPTSTTAPQPAPAPALLAHAASLGDPFTAVAAHRLAQLDPTVVERLHSWTPQLAQRGVKKAEWTAWEALVRTAAVCAKPSNETVAASLLGTALGLTQYAVTTRYAAVRAEFVFRDTTAQLYLATLPTGTQHVVKSHLKALVAGITSATTEPLPDATSLLVNAPQAPAGDSDDTDGETVVEPLLLEHGRVEAEQLRTLRLTTPAAREVLDVLAAIRARVLAVEPSAFAREPRFTGRARAVPYGDVEVVALLAAARAQRTAKGRLHATATICLGIGAGVVGENAANLKGADVLAHDADIGGPAVRTPHGLAPLHAAFAAPVIAAARAAGPTGWLLGGGQARVTRISRISVALATSDPRNIRLSSRRLGATWFALHLTRGVAVGHLLALCGYVSAAPIDSILIYLPQATAHSNAQLSGRILGTTPLAPTGTVADTDEPDEEQAS